MGKLDRRASFNIRCAISYRKTGSVYSSRI